ncbi:hypothetical protein [Thalassolituus oleivorans]|uniref:hypothetical protein n=1 Tax=Thalassolituus oleivorans TaxID=187493 RepID=UPI001B540CB9|nr:hypothetical protein [Thalassolituus oleivorans]MBQ0727709.1 hypothetical protein [Thalassolituus oleivorans]MBQ0780214.1 hypothetical protein [Thalassolituus oleivorans]
MRNFLKYPNIKLREQKKPCNIQGPSFTWAKNISFMLADNIIKIKAPRHAPNNSYHEQFRALAKDNNFECRPMSESRMPSQNWLEFFSLARQWAFYGPWFIGHVTDLNVASVIITRNPENIDPNKTLVSMFHPRVFENELCDYLTDCYGHKYDKSEADWIAPINWQPVTGLSIFAARFDIAPFHMPNTREHCLALPLTDNHILLFSFSLSESVKATNIQNGKCDFSDVTEERFHIDEAPVLELMENIIQSISITLSPENQQAYDKVKAENPDLEMAVCDTIMPLKWPVS